MVNLSTVNTTVPATKVTVSIRDIEGQWRPLICRSVNSLDLPYQTVTRTMLKELNITAPVPILDNTRPMVLIGLDNGHLTMATGSQASCETGVTAVKTPLGWLLEGAIRNEDRGTLLHFVGHDLEKTVLEYINNDGFGLGIDDGNSRSVEDMISLKILEKGTRKVGNRFECPLLWRNS